MKNRIKSLLLMAALALNLSVTQPARAGSFTTTGTLIGARAGHSATLLLNGTVLAEGGFDGTGPGRLATAELYSPATGSWTATGPLSIGRTTHTATLLPNGKVLAAAGHDSGSTSTATCELYDPAAGTWTATGGMATARAVHTATLLLNGKVLVAGGAPDSGASGYSSFSSAELYDPDTGTWAATGSMNCARLYHAATLLPDGRVLVSGGASAGYFISCAEIYNPATGVWSGTGPLATARGIHTATLRPDGKVLAVGGNHSSPADPLVTLSSAELYDPASGVWTATGPLNAARTTHTATLMPSGKVLIAAGYNANLAVQISSAELYGSTTVPIALVNPVKLPGGGFRFAFIGAPTGTNTVLATTDPKLPLSNWTVLGAVPEFSPGLFVFTDPQAATGPQRFYRLRSP